MYKHILIATDGSESSAQALTAGLDLARQLNCKATVVTVTEPWTAGGYEVIPTPSLIEAYDRTTAKDAKAILADATKAAEGSRPLRDFACQRPICRGRHHRDRKGYRL